MQLYGAVAGRCWPSHPHCVSKMHFLIAENVGRPTAVPVVVRIRTVHPRNRSSTHGSDGKFTSPRKREDGLWGPPTLLLNTYRKVCPHVQRDDASSSLITPSKVGGRGQNEWSYASTLRYPFMTSTKTTHSLSLQPGI